MNNIFDNLKSVLFTKNRHDINEDDESSFSLYMLNRWISMYSKEMCNYVNETSNTYRDIFNTTNEQFRYIMNIMPHLKYKRIDYIKKEKKNEEEKESDNVVPEFYSRKIFYDYEKLSKKLVDNQ